MIKEKEKIKEKAMLQGNGKCTFREKRGNKDVCVPSTSNLEKWCENQGEIVRVSGKDEFGKPMIETFYDCKLEVKEEHKSN